MKMYLERVWIHSDGGQADQEHWTRALKQDKVTVVSCRVRLLHKELSPGSFVREVREFERGVESH